MSAINKMGSIARKIERLGTSLSNRLVGRYCPICESWSRRFLPFGIDPRDDAQCPCCGALERHRLLWLFLLRKTDLFESSKKKFLHIAPEYVFQQIFEDKFGECYLTADLHDPKAKIRMDITSIEFPDESFDNIYCSHVLEHIPDDRKAMRELRRVLKKDGWAILLVPIRSKVTEEDLTITDPEERTRRYGQQDHVRNYGEDFLDRLIEEGFDANKIEAPDFLSRSQIKRMGITASAGEIFFCVRG